MGTPKSNSHHIIQYLRIVFINQSLVGVDHFDFLTQTLLLPCSIPTFGLSCKPSRFASATTTSRES